MIVRRLAPQALLATLLTAACARPATRAPEVAPAPAERATFYLLSGDDTVAAERVEREGGRVAGELVDRAHGARVRWTLEHPAGVAWRLTTTLQRAQGDTTLLQRGVLTMLGDTVTAEITLGGAMTKRFASHPGALPYLNPSPGMIEEMVRHQRARRVDPDTVWVFQATGGKTLPAVVRPLGPDTVIVSLGTVQLRIATDGVGRLLGGAIPSQDLVIVRVAGDRALGAAPPPDYSAPAGAPYTAEEVTLRGPTGLRLTGTLTRPIRNALVPAVVTITGSGAEDRDEAIPIVPGYRPFRQVADTLARRGIAVLRLDDRGVGGSEAGPAGSGTTADFADDVRAALAWLRTRPDIDGTRLGLVGHSEGGIIGPMVAATDSGLRALVVLAGPARALRSVIGDQQRWAVEHDTAIAPARRDSALRVMAHALDSITAVQPWMHWLIDYDPLATARRVRTPVLVLQGANDRQVTMEQAEQLAAAFRAGGNRDVTVRVFPATNHLFIADSSGDPAGYAKLKERGVRPEVLGAIADWIAERMR